jgi:hypothetical protein
MAPAHHPAHCDHPSQQYPRRWARPTSTPPGARARFTPAGRRCLGPPTAHVSLLQRGIRLARVQAPASPEVDRWLAALLVLWEDEERSSQADRWAGRLHLQRVRRPVQRDHRGGAKADKVMPIACPPRSRYLRWLIHLEQSHDLRPSQLQSARSCDSHTPGTLARGILYRTHRYIRYPARPSAGSACRPRG